MCACLPACVCVASNNWMMMIISKYTEGCICGIIEFSIAHLSERTEDSHEKFWTEQSVARSITSPPECKSQGLPLEAVCSVPTCGRRTVKGSINEEPKDSERHGPIGMLVDRSGVARRTTAGIWHAPLGYRSGQSPNLTCCKFPFV